MKANGIVIFLFSILLTLSLHAQTANDTIDPDHFNYALLQSLYLDQFNTFRTSIHAPKLEPDPILQKAAQDQVEYCTKMNLVTHYQPENTQKYMVKNRVQFYHGTHPYVGENCLMTFLGVPATDPHTQKTTTITTYGQLAKGLFQLWKNSPPHYQNMINTVYTNSGIAVSIYENKKVIYATQVFGCAPYTPPHNALKYTDTTWGVKEHVDSKCKSYGDHDYLANIYADYLSNYGDNVFQYYQDETVTKSLFTGPKDGMAVDIVTKDQFFCDKPNNFHPSTVFDGYMLPPKYRDEIFKNDLYKNNELLSLAGVVPPTAPRKDIQFNAIMIQNGMACRYSYPVKFERDILKDLPIYPQWCKAEGTITKGVADLDREFKIPFEKSVTKQDTFYFKNLKELLSVFEGAITSIEVNAYSSVEGTEANNIQLQQARADFIANFIKKNMKQDVPIKKNVSENWPMFYQQIENAEFCNFFPDTTRERLRYNVNSRKEEYKLSEWLYQQRVATVKIHLHKEYDDKTEVRFMPLVMCDKMYQNDSAQAIIAYSRVIDAYQNGDLSKNYLSAIDVPLNRRFLPIVNNYFASIIVKSDIFDYGSYSQSYFEYIDSAVKKFSDFQPLKFNMIVYKTHLYFHGLLRDTFGFTKLQKVVDTLCKDTTLDKKLRYQLEFNYYLSGSIYYLNCRRFSDMYYCFERVKALLPVTTLKAKEVYDVGKYFNYFGRVHETTLLLESYMDRYPDDEDLIFLYVSTGGVVNIKIHEKLDLYYQQIDKLAIKNKPRLCKWFNENYQLLREPEFKTKICPYCKLEY